MSVRIRLARCGLKKKPCYRIVVADARFPRDGKFIEKLGVYHPLVAKGNDCRVIIKSKDRVSYWLSKGAQPTVTVERILGLATYKKRVSRILASQKKEKERKAVVAGKESKKKSKVS